jgi:hypothetical protein
VPGAVVGAGLGFDAGLVVLEWVGLAFMAGTIGMYLGIAIKLSGRAVSEAWNAVDDPASRRYHVDHAGRTLAQAVGVLMRGILQGVVAFLLAKGAESAATRVPELVAKLRQSRFGEAFAGFIERNWARLVKNEKLLPKKEAPAGGGVSGKGSGGEAPAPPKPKQEPPPPKPKEPEKPSGKAATAAERAAILKEMNDVAKTADVSTPQDGLYLWSGGGMDGAGGAAMKTAEASGGRTLEMTEAGQKLSALQEKLGPWKDFTEAEKEQSMLAWRTASERLADGASGNVNIVVEPTKLRSDAIVFNELEVLGTKDAVTNVTVMDTSGEVISSGSASDAIQALQGIAQ